MSVDHLLLEGYLNTLRLHSFVRHYGALAEDAAQTNQPYHRFLLALAQQEVADRDRQRQQQRIRAAKFPLLKDLSDFNFAAIPSLNPQRLFDLARGEYIAKAEPIILVGQPGLGKTQPT